ncbi:MAG: bifunctional diaminohydroxyphosphoribosylaminopyrimidine deaminase/5-amino-6-(5-phosphoribosylamino)uracil reductase RibD, partial [Planctomycetota bacterium]|nr:bifunctional diaminohydroxyphosphoribosylaminopyrimidine deaminase/5-amino-6-(5-phosphoribosylamino)uracil reductase RibD [Planctomycetota bacterium]
MDRSTIEHFMALAMAEGRKGGERCLPNPAVGCVLTRDGKVISTGCTQEPGGPHAEVAAMDGVEGGLGDVTAFVTLEPCSFEGRTPSCARELVRRGLGEIHVGVIDPHPRNRGAGIKILKEGGVIVGSGTLEGEIRAELADHFQKYG